MRSDQGHRGEENMSAKNAIDQVFDHQVPDTEPTPETEHVERDVYMVRRDVYMVNVNAFSGCVFVKTYEFFRSQGGFVEEWGKNWVPLMATSIEDAREMGCALPSAKPYDKQAK